MSKTVNGTTTGYYLDGDTILIEKTNGVNSAQYTWGDGLIRCNGEYPMEDGRGNVRFTTNASKTVTSANMPSAFGQASVTANTASAFSWNAKSGYRQDSVAPTGLSTAYSFQKVGDRYYDPTLLCFLTRDTELDQLPYTYCGGDPVNFTDPTGHFQVDDGPFRDAVDAVVNSSGGSAIVDAFNNVFNLGGKGGFGGGSGGGKDSSGSGKDSSGGDKKGRPLTIGVDINRGKPYAFSISVPPSESGPGFSLKYKKLPGQSSELNVTGTFNVK